MNDIVQFLAACTLGVMLIGVYRKRFMPPYNLLTTIDELGEGTEEEVLARINAIPNGRTSQWILRQQLDRLRAANLISFGTRSTSATQQRYLLTAAGRERIARRTQRPALRNGKSA